MKRYVLGVVGIVFVVSAIAAIAFWRAGGQESDILTTQVVRSDVVEEIAFTGRLEAKEHVQLGFEGGGIVRDLEVTEGAFVETGQTLARLDTRSSALEVAQARASRVSKEQELYLAWQKAENDWNNAKTENEKAIAEQKERVRNLKAEMDQAKRSLEVREEDEGDGSYLAQTARSSYLTAKSAYENAQQALTTLQASAARSGDSGQLATEIAKEQYVATKQASGSVSGLSSLEATEQLARVRMLKSVLVSPITGVVTDIALDEGEFAGAGQAVITVQTVGQLDITADVTETDVVKLIPGMPATITLDAFSGTEVWDAKVGSIAPAAKIIEGLPTYEVVIDLVDVDTRLKPGLTANVTVHVAKREGVLAVPRRSVITQGTRQFVRVRGEDGFIAEYDVVTGLEGSEGLVEIISGVREGQDIVVRSSGE